MNLWFIYWHFRLTLVFTFKGTQHEIFKHSKKNAADTLNAFGAWVRKDQEPNGDDYFTIFLVVMVNLVALGAGLFVGYFFGVSSR